eukprot:CAMPEP_0118710524 /NCGR_PEP_ID=MMETSP0800-20121206/23439_1 /TAXON_ID=210618 ORGANISM="Striatella unipunctata, Strain CCMP2910" /NCGR_SAMPLE_ID=MMETSP0800 /ASSEMBLY_ACC=CAM_ASM_000638 /LENGTH=42 /DNA_ID= /DNA_START= /DNA_END= /DNA_ORIENTATION=
MTKKKKGAMAVIYVELPTLKPLLYAMDALILRYEEVSFDIDT